MIFSLIAMTIAFTGLLIWVYRPSQRAHFEAQGMLVFERDQFRNGAGKGTEGSTDE